MNGNTWNDSIYQNKLSNFMYKVFAFMAAALLVTGITAAYVSQSPTFVTSLFTKPFLLFGIFIVQIGLVLAINFLVFRVSFPILLLLFFLYSLSLGLTLSSIFLVYQLGSIYLTFFVTAALFAVMAVYGYYTKTDLTSMGKLATMALFGIIIALLINLFLRSPLMDTVISAIGVLIFVALIAFDAQRIKQIGSQVITSEGKENNAAIIGALMLYLDVINLFLFLLRFLGKRRD